MLKTYPEYWNDTLSPSNPRVIPHKFEGEVSTKEICHWHILQYSTVCQLSGHKAEERGKLQIESFSIQTTCKMRTGQYKRHFKRC